jgi:general secretion pathway protein G
MKRMIATVKQQAAARGPLQAASQDLGMTLLEIMIVLALVGLVMGAIGFGLNNHFKKEQKKTAQIEVGRIAQAAQQYMMENNSNCPASIDDLVANKKLPRQPKDPWGKEYTMKCPGTGDPDGVDIMSSGPDNQEGTVDDVKSWEL